MRKSVSVGHILLFYLIFHLRSFSFHSIYAFSENIFLVRTLMIKKLCKKQISSKKKTHIKTAIQGWEMKM